MDSSHLKKDAWVFAAVVVVAAAVYTIARMPVIFDRRVSPTTSDVAQLVYRDDFSGAEIQYPSSWFAYGEASDFAPNDDVLSWRGFVPDFDPAKSMEQQELFSVSTFRENTESSFDMPKRYLVKDRDDETWKPVTVNEYLGTKITNTATRTVTDYVFEREGKLVVLSASRPDLFDVILPTLAFF